MSTDTKKTLRDVSAPFKLGLILLLIAGLIGLILGGAYALTKDRIAVAKEAANKAAYAAVLPAEADISALEEVSIPAEYEADVLAAFKAGDSGYCLQVSGKGYGGTVVVAVGLDQSGAVTGIEIVDHAETPGLGANATNDSFKGQFTGASGQLTVVKGDAGAGEITALSGATITSRCVTGCVNKALAYYADVLKGGN